METERRLRLALVAVGLGIAALAGGAVLFLARFPGLFDRALGELLMRLGIGACLLGSIAIVAVRRRPTL
jgi:hypothetical protein